MTTEQIKNKILKYHWEPWLKRPFFGFIISTFARGNSKKAFQKINLPGWEYQSFMFSNGEWFQAEEVYLKTKKIVLNWLKKHQVKEISARLEKFRLTWKKEIIAFTKEPKSNSFRKLYKLDGILREVTTYVWATHVLEHFFTPKLRAQTQKYIFQNADKFIGDASFPVKLNAAAQMVEDFKQGASIKLLAKEYGWMRARDGFSRPYTETEIMDIIKNALKQSLQKRPQIPKPLRSLFTQARELVYLRMLRMDVYFELMYLAKPLLRAIAEYYGISFPKLKYYTVDGLISGKLKFYAPNFAGFSYRDKIFYFNKPLFTRKFNKEIKELKGSIAQKGIAIGKARIVMHVEELNKVKKGDILVTYMTSPNFLPAMRLAAAFVTDEGGLTCHAAIVAREMGKPCVIGTKIATKVFKDGDVVEVDAKQGIVRKLEN